MAGAGHDEEALVGACELREDGFAEVAGVGFFAVDDEDGAADFAGVGHQGGIEEGNGGGDVPALGGVERAGVVAARGLVVGVVVAEELRGVVGQGVGNAAGPAGFAPAQVVEAGRGQAGAKGMAGGLGVVGVEVAVGRDAAHVVEGGGDGDADAGIGGGGIDGQPAPAADADNADPVRVGVGAEGEAVDGGEEVFGIEVGGGDVARVAAAFAGVGGIEGEGQEAAGGQGLRVEAGALLLDGAEGAADGERRQGAPGLGGTVEVSGERDAEAVAEGDLGAAHARVGRKGLAALGGGEGRKGSGRDGFGCHGSNLQCQGQGQQGGGAGAEQAEGYPSADAGCRHGGVSLGIGLGG